MTGSRMNVSKIIAVVAVVGVLGAGATAGSAAEEPHPVETGIPGPYFDGGFSPTVLSKTEPIPIAFRLSGDFQRSDGTHPPALTELIVEADKNLAVNVRGYPVCSPLMDQSVEPATPEQRCKRAIVGRGTMEIEIAFPEEAPISLKSNAIVVNGGKRTGVTNLNIYTYITVPTPAAILTKVQVKKIHNGRFGTEAVATIPKIAGGSGSVTAFNFKIDKKFSYRGRRVSVLTLKCPDGKILTRTRANFADGTSAQEELIRTCRPSP
jgi:hypothetical protein